MKKVRIERLFHRNWWRYAIFSVYDAEVLRITRSIPGIRYSGTHKCWYTDESESNLKIILKAFEGKADIESTSVSIEANQRFVKKAPSENSSEYSKKDVCKKDAIELLQRRKEEDNESRSQVTIIRKNDPVEFRLTEDHLIIRFTGRYDGSWVEEIKSYGKYRYDRSTKEFHLPWTKMTVDSLTDYFSSKGVEIRVKKKEVNKGTKETRSNFKEGINSKELTSEGIEAIRTLKQYLEKNRYSIRTIESYTSVLEIFFKYFNNKSPREIEYEDISDFITDTIIKNKFSASYQNQLISAIKLYYENSGKSSIIPSIIERPRRGRPLPKVFSKEEVTRILNSAGNIKHKLLLWIIYSCGLRRSEVINLLLTDIDRDRNILHIREGKGGVDRIVPVPDKVWAKYDEYIASYHPVKYIFEGQTGGRYSAESVYNVFKHAMKNAGIKKDVGVHSLRHSFATHLHENGLDIRFIQELLGHKSTRTTEIYTHVSRRSIAAIKSPIEDLDLK